MHMPSAALETAILAIKRPHTYPLDRKVTGFGTNYNTKHTENPTNDTMWLQSSVSDL
jgi:hypothetical protein